MSELGENVPSYQKVRVGVQEPAAAVADVDAWKAREHYPDLLGGGGPLFGVALELETGGWEILAFGDATPQSAREGLSSVMRRRASNAAKAGDADARAEFLRAAERLDHEVVDELTVVGSRYRVLRAEPYIRMGPTGPEPPRPSDPDPVKPKSGPSREEDRPVTGFVIDPLTESGMSEAILRVELLSRVPKRGLVPADVHRDAEAAQHTHPGGLLLPVEFMTVEYVDGDWRSTAATSPTPQAARDTLALYLRVLAPVLEGLDNEARVAYAEAADRLDAERPHEIEVAGKPIRVVRVERLVRIGPDGPEGPRPSDFDPDPPIGVITDQDRAQGVDIDYNERPEPSEAVTEMSRLMRLEEERKERLRDDKQP
jgi:hypothetical protein